MCTSLHTCVCTLVCTSTHVYANTYTEYVHIPNGKVCIVSGCSNRQSSYYLVPTTSSKSKWIWLSPVSYRLLSSWRRLYLMSVHSLFLFPNYVFGCVLLIRSVTKDWKRKCSVWAGKSRKLSFYGRWDPVDIWRLVFGGEWGGYPRISDSTSWVHR